MTNIVMLFHSRYKLAKQSLDSLFAHTKCNDYTLTMVYDVPDDKAQRDFRLKDLLNAESTRSNATLLTVKHSGHVLAQLKNLGVAWSEQCFDRGDWLYLSDSDVYFTPSWLDKLTKFADDKINLWESPVLVGGQIHPFHKPDEHGYLRVLDGPSWLMGWTVWDLVGGFKRINASGVCQSEEYPLCQKLRDNGGMIEVIEPHVVYHTGLTNSDGKPAPGYEERKAQMVQGVYYE